MSSVKQEAVAEVEPAHGELDDFVVPPASDTGVDAFTAEAEGQLGELLDVPFGPLALAVLTPATPVTPETLGNAFARRWSWGSSRRHRRAWRRGTTPGTSATGLIGVASRRLRK